MNWMEIPSLDARLRNVVALLFTFQFTESYFLFVSRFRCDNSVVVLNVQTNAKPHAYKLHFLVLFER